MNGQRMIGGLFASVGILAMMLGTLLVPVHAPVWGDLPIDQGGGFETGAVCKSKNSEPPKTNHDCVEEHPHCPDTVPDCKMYSIPGTGAIVCDCRPE